MKKSNKPGSASLNLTPLIGDFTLLTFGVLILVFAGALFTLTNTEMPKSFETDKYFPSGHWVLRLEDEIKLYSFIEDSIFTQIKQEFEKGSSLTSLRIEGHSDIIKPKPKEDKKILGLITIKNNRRWEDNIELSFLRAKQVSSIFSRIIENSSFSLEKKQKLNKMMIVSGIGPNQPQFKAARYLGKYYAVEIDSVDNVNNDDLKNYYNKLKDRGNNAKNGPFDTMKLALEKSYELNRRVVIKLVKKGL